MSQQVALNSQIIRVLCLGTGQLADILAQLTTRYPASGWTASMLSTLLALGVKQGRFIQVTKNPDRWQVRQNMAVVYPANVVYQNLCPGITKQYGCSGMSAYENSN